MPIRKISRIAVTALEDIKARDITVFDVRKLTSLYDTLIIATAESNRQVKALAHHVRDVAVTDRGAMQPDAGLPQRDLQTHITHHGRDHLVAGKAFAAAPGQGAHAQHAIAIHQPAA